MFKIMLRVVLATIAGLGCCCVVEPEAPRSLLKNFIETQEATAVLADNSKPKLEVAVAKATLAVLNGEASQSTDGVESPALMDVAKQRLNGMFFSDKPTADATGEPEESILSKLKSNIPFLSGDSKPNYAPIDVGSAIQSNPYLK